MVGIQNFEDQFLILDEINNLKEDLQKLSSYVSRGNGSKYSSKVQIPLQMVRLKLQKILRSSQYICTKTEQGSGSYSVCRSTLRPPPRCMQKHSQSFVRPLPSVCRSTLQSFARPRPVVCRSTPRHLLAPSPVYA